MNSKQKSLYPLVWFSVNEELHHIESDHICTTDRKIWKVGRKDIRPQENNNNKKMSADFVALCWFIVWWPKCRKRNPIKQQVDKKKVQYLICSLYYCCDFPHNSPLFKGAATVTANVQSAWRTKCWDHSPDSWQHTAGLNGSHTWCLLATAINSFFLFLNFKFKLKEPQSWNSTLWFYWRPVISEMSECVCLLLWASIFSVGTLQLDGLSTVSGNQRSAWLITRCCFNPGIGARMGSARSRDLLEKRIHG